MIIPLTSLIYSCWGGSPSESQYDQPLQWLACCLWHFPDIGSVHLFKCRLVSQIISQNNTETQEGREDRQARSPSFASLYSSNTPTPSIWTCIAKQRRGLGIKSDPFVAWFLSTDYSRFSDTLIYWCLEATQPLCLGENYRPASVPWSYILHWEIQGSWSLYFTEKGQVSDWALVIKYLFL